MPVMQLPFSGWHESRWDAALDGALETLIEDFSHDVSRQIARTFGVVADSEELSDIIRGAARFDFAEIERDYAGRFGARLIAELGIPVVGLFGSAKRAGINDLFRHHSTESPKFYNFETDRIFAHVGPIVVRKMYEKTPTEVLNSVAERRHKSRPGFASFYRHDTRYWPLAVNAWDHNQLCTLLIAFMEHRAIGDLEEDLLERAEEAGVFFNAITIDDDTVIREFARRRQIQPRSPE